MVAYAATAANDMKRAQNNALGRIRSLLPRLLIAGYDGYLKPTRRCPVCRRAKRKAGSIKCPCRPLGSRTGVERPAESGGLHNVRQDSSSAAGTGLSSAAREQTEEWLARRPSRWPDPLPPGCPEIARTTNDTVTPRSSHRWSGAPTGAAVGAGRRRPGLHRPADPRGGRLKPTRPPKGHPAPLPKRYSATSPARSKTPARLINLSRRVARLSPRLGRSVGFRGC